MSALFEQLGVEISNQLVFKIVASVVVLLILWILRGLASSLVKQRLSELARYHHWRQGHRLCPYCDSCHTSQHNLDQGGQRCCDIPWNHGHRYRGGDARYDREPGRMDIYYYT